MKKRVLSLICVFVSILITFCVKFQANAANYTIPGANTSSSEFTGVTNCHLIVSHTIIGDESDTTNKSFYLHGSSNGTSENQQWKKAFMYNGSSLMIHDTNWYRVDGQTVDPLHQLANFKDGEIYNVVVDINFSSSKNYGLSYVVYINGVSIATVTSTGFGTGTNYKWTRFSDDNFKMVGTKTLESFEPDTFFAKIISVNEKITIIPSQTRYENSTISIDSQNISKVSELISEITITSDASAFVTRDSQVLSDGELLNSGDILNIKSSNETYIQYYKIKVRKPSNINAECDASFETLILTGELFSDSSAFTIKIFNYDEAGNYTPDAPSIYEKTLELDADNIINSDVTLPLDFPGGKYIACIFYSIDGIQNKIYDDFIFVNSDAQETIDFIDDLNAASSGEFISALKDSNNCAILGFDSDDFSGIDTTFVFGTAYDMKNLQDDGKHTFETLVFAIRSSIAAYHLKENGAKNCEKYKEYIGEKGYQDYEKLTLTEKTKLDELLDQADYSSAYLSDIFTEQIFVSKLSTAEGRNMIKTLLSENAKYIDIDMSSPNSKYLEITPEHQYKVFEKFFQKVSTATSKRSAKDLFDKCVSEVLKELNEPPHQKPVSSGPGSSSFITSNTNILNPNNIEKPQNAQIKESFTQQYAVNKLVELGVMKGYPDGSLGTEHNVTRAEFSKMIYTAFNIPENHEAEFADVKENDWFSTFVSSLANANIITGYNGYFNPDSHIKREDAIVMLYRYAIVKSIIFSGEDIVFSDNDNISNYAKNAVNEFARSKIVQGDGKCLYPKKNITRGEAAILIVKLLEYGSI